MSSAQSRRRFSPRGRAGGWRRAWIRGALVLALAALASAKPSFAKARDKYPAMDPEAASVRDRLAIVRRQLPRMPTYGPFGECTFDSRYELPDGTRNARRFKLRMAVAGRARDRLLVTSNYGASVSTAVIGTDGRLYDFNLVGSDGVRWTPETYHAQASAVAERNNLRGEVIDNFTVAYPAYLQLAWKPGQTVATIYAEDRSVWATLVYQGLSGSESWQAAIVDIVRPASAGGQTVGFSIVELSSMVPLMTALKTRFNSWRLERAGCP